MFFKFSLNYFISAYENVSEPILFVLGYENTNKVRSYVHLKCRSSLKDKTVSVVTFTTWTVVKVL